MAAGGASAQTVDENAMADLGALLHVGEHPGASLLVPSVVGVGRHRWHAAAGQAKGAALFGCPSATPPVAALSRRRSE
jgi:hypothetical protein